MKLPYEVHKNGENFDVVNKDNGSVKATHLPPDAKEKADAQVKLLHQIEDGMNDGTE
jgi:hypothetical protein